MRTIANELNKYAAILCYIIVTGLATDMYFTMKVIRTEQAIIKTKVEPIPTIMDEVQNNKKDIQTNREQILILKTKEEAKKNVVVKKNLLSSPNYMHPFNVIDTSGKSIDKLIKDVSIIEVNN
jgi:hypothetical protein